MKPHHNLAETKTPDGARLSLHEHDGSYCIRLNGQDLMHSVTSASEILLGELAAAHLSKNASARVLIGGLGLGYTLKAVLAKAGAKALVEVGELMPEVVEWNRTFMAGLNGRLLEDPRVQVRLGDVVDTISRARPASYDAILLDVDNGPTPMVRAGNVRLYGPRGLEILKARLKPGGRLAIWSASPDRSFEARLRAAGFVAEAVPAKLFPTAKRSAYVIYIGDKPASGV
ncbi:MAG: spermine synthase [Verrucomicrobia bacterium]|nr:spermine synthase [Verrucomicrobiota bacterium]